MRSVKIHFLGASHTVTGAKFFLETPELNILVDCGMFQGLKELRLLNWEPLPVAVPKIDVVLLTHGHLDHTGYLPRLVKQGFRGRILGTPPTLAITRIVLLDSARIHEEEASQANSEGYSTHRPALPLYTLNDAENAIALFQPKEIEEWISLSENVRYKFRSNGHIIGSTYIEMDIFGKIFVFSGDVGRENDLLLEPPERPKWADYLIMESTYGNKLHPIEDVDAIFTKLIKKALLEKGTVIIPSFAVERLQTLMYKLWQLYKKNRIPNIPIFIDSPMGTNVLSVFEQFPAWHRLTMSEYRIMCRHFQFVSSYADTWKTIDDPRPKVVIAGSGMVSGGRVLTYLRQLIGNSQTSVLLVGYQAEGTRGRQLLDGTHEIKIFGSYHPVKANILHLEGLSAHADQSELMNWVSDIRNIPEKVFLVHGEPSALDTLRVKISDLHHWPVCLPRLNETFELLV